MSETFTASSDCHCDACGAYYSEGATIGYAGRYDRPLCEDCLFLHGDD